LLEHSLPHHNIMLVKQVVVGMLSVLEAGQIQIREDTVVYEDGMEISRTYRRTLVNPEDDLASQSKLVQDIAALVWTPETIEKYKKQQEEIQKRTGIPPPIDPNSLKPPNTDNQQ
jgi:hypothetical protein